VDFSCAEKAVVIEVDGDVHGVEDQVVRDQEREKDLRSLGLRIIRDTNAGSTSPHPSLQRRGIEVPKD